MIEPSGSIPSPFSPPISVSFRACGKERQIGFAAAAVAVVFSEMMADKEGGRETGSFSPRETERKMLVNRDGKFLRKGFPIEVVECEEKCPPRPA